MREHPKVGQTLFNLNIGNAARCTPQVLTPVKVTKVGRQYFYCGEGWQAIKYNLEDWSEASNYSANSKLFRTEQEYLDAKEATKLLALLRDSFSSYGTTKFSLQQLRDIKAICEQTGTTTKGT